MTLLLGMLKNLLPESGDYRLHWMTQQRTDDKDELGNVRWATRREQQQTRRGTIMTFDRIILAKRLKKQGISITQLAKLFNATVSCISLALKKVA